MGAAHWESNAAVSERTLKIYEQSRRSAGSVGQPRVRTGGRVDVDERAGPYGCSHPPGLAYTDCTGSDACLLQP
jgi:hypothetical protein